MTADQTNCPTCAVCHRRLTIGETYLTLHRGDRTTVVHEHVCFPPRHAKRRG